MRGYGQVLILRRRVVVDLFCQSKGREAFSMTSVSGVIFMVPISTIGREFSGVTKGKRVFSLMICLWRYHHGLASMGVMGRVPFFPISKDIRSYLIIISVFGEGVQVKRNGFFRRIASMNTLYLYHLWGFTSNENVMGRVPSRGYYTVKDASFFIYGFF